MAARIHLRPLLGPERSRPGLLLTSDTFAVEKWLRRLGIREDDLTAINHGWLLAEAALLRLQAAVTVSNHGACVNCTNEAWCAWAMEHADSLEELPYVIPFTRSGGVKGYHGGDRALLDLGIRKSTLGDVVGELGRQIRDGIETMVKDPEFQRRAQEILLEQAREAFGRAFGGGAAAAAMDADAVRERAEDILGLTGRYTESDVARAKRAAAMRYHPDRPGGGDPAKAAAANAAADVLVAALRDRARG